MNRYATLIGVLAAVWGASYLFIKVAVEGGLPPAPLMAARALIAATCLFAYLVATVGGRSAIRDLRASWRLWAPLGAIANAAPFWLVAWGEQHIDSGIAAIAQSTVPIFTILLGLRFLPHEPLGTTRIVGIVTGLAGVGVLAGARPEGGWWVVAGTLAVVLSSLLYASGNILGQRSVASAPGPVLACGAMTSATVVLTPFALLELPEVDPTAGALASLAALALLGTALAQLVLYRVLRLYGGRRLSLVTYLLPGVALGYGALVLDEPLTLASLGGLALILGGVALGSRTASRPPD